MTYGEAHTAVKFGLCMKDGEFTSIKKPWHKPRMSREEASAYYNKKARRVFEELGYKYKRRESEIAKKMDTARIEREPSMDQFEKVEDYYDYFEAMRVMEALEAA